MPRFRSRRGYGVRRAKRRLVWAHEDQSFGAATSGQIDLLTDSRTLMGTSANILGITIRRVRISIEIIFDVTTNGLLATSGIFLGLRKDYTGAATVVTPLSNPAIDWSFTQFLPAVTPGSGVAAPEAVDKFACSYILDSKAMRKMQEIQESYFLSWATQGADSATVFVSANTLLMLP